MFKPIYVLLIPMAVLSLPSLSQGAISQTIAQMGYPKPSTPTVPTQFPQGGGGALNYALTTAMPSTGFTKITQIIGLNKFDGQHTNRTFWATQNGWLNTANAFYYGLQPCATNNDNTAVFSIFGTGSTFDPTQSPYCEGGADGGSGMGCHMPYPLDEGGLYEFVIQSVGTSTDGTQTYWQASVVELNSATSVTPSIIGTAIVPTSWGNINGPGGSFTEYYGGGPQNNQPYSEVMWTTPTGYYGSTAYPTVIQNESPGLNAASGTAVFYTAADNSYCYYDVGTHQIATTLWPQTATVAPGGTFPFAPSGVHTPIALSVMSGGSGGTIDTNTGIYTAPQLKNSMGLDFILATDANGIVATTQVLIAAPQSLSSGTSLSTIALSKGTPATSSDSYAPQIWYSAPNGSPGSGFTKQTSALGLTQYTAGDTSNWGYLNWFTNTGNFRYAIAGMNTAHFEINGGSTGTPMPFSSTSSSYCQTTTGQVQCNLPFSFKTNVLYQFTLKQIPSDQPQTTLWDMTFFDPTTFIAYEIGRVYVPSSWGTIGSNGQAYVSRDAYPTPSTEPFSESIFGSPILFVNDVSSMSNIWSYNTGSNYNIMFYPSPTNSYVIVDSGNASL